MFALLKQLIGKNKLDPPQDNVSRPLKTLNGQDENNSELDLESRGFYSGIEKKEKYEKVIERLFESKHVKKIQAYFSDPDQELDNLNRILFEFYEETNKNDFSITLRIFDWSGNLIAQKGKSVSLLKKSITFETSTGEYIVEIGVSPKVIVEEKYRLLWFGLDYAGKTSLINRLQYNEFKPQTRTIGQNIDDFIVEGLRITSIDLAGQEALREYWKNILFRPDIIIYVIDVSDHARIEEAMFELKDKVINNDRYENVPILMVFNKIDLLADKNVGRIVADRLNLGEIMGLRTWNVIPVSAKTGENMDSLIRHMARMIKAKR